MLKAGWLGFVFFVWIVGVFLGSTYDYNNSVSGAGMAYSTGTATFVTNNATVVGVATGWSNSTMAGGNIMMVADGIWHRVSAVNNATQLTLANGYTGAGGAGQNYLMAASAGWAGTGTGGYSTAPITKMSHVISIWKAEQKIPVLGTIGALVTSSDFWDIVWQMTTWRWTFLEDYEMFYWFICFPFVIMGVLSLVLILYGILTGNLTW